MKSILKLFGGRLVRIYSKLTKMVQGQDGNVLEIPVYFEGYLMDEDDQYYYLSYELDVDRIAAVVKKDNELAIEDLDLVAHQEDELLEQELITEAMSEKSKKTNLN